jgi:hypothetical protein
MNVKPNYCIFYPKKDCTGKAVIPRVGPAERVFTLKERQAARAMICY